MHLQGGTHRELPLPVVLIVDGTSRLLTEAGVGFGMVEVEVMEFQISELIDSKVQNPRDVCPSDGEGVVVCWGEGHGVVVKYLSWWICL